MFIQQTTPTKVTKEQYDNATIAINRQTAEHWLIYKNDNNDQQCVYVGKSDVSLRFSVHEMYRGEFDAQPKTVDIIDRSGKNVKIEAIVFDTRESGANIDLDALAKGEISWIK